MACGPTTTAVAGPSSVTVTSLLTVRHGCHACLQHGGARMPEMDTAGEGMLVHCGPDTQTHTEARTLLMHWRIWWTPTHARTHAADALEDLMDTHARTHAADALEDLTRIYTQRHARR
eukprot:1158367-Pelagomonas_calceolata.AAC.4